MSQALTVGTSETAFIGSPASSSRDAMPEAAVSSDPSPNDGEASVAPDPPATELEPSAQPPVNPHRNSGGLEQLAEAQRIVARLHKNLGHPGAEQLMQQLRGRGALPALVQAASSYRCPTCAQLAPRHQVPKYSLRQPSLNQRLMADTFAGRTVLVLSMLDAATKYVVARPLQSETSEQFLRAIERGWVKLFGPPHVLQVDAHPSWSSAAAREWATMQGVELLISPGEAHQRLAQVERRHQVLRRAIDEPSISIFRSTVPRRAGIIPYSVGFGISARAGVLLGGQPP